MNIELIENIIRECQKEAQKSIDSGNPPFGCILTDATGEVLARGHNTTISDMDMSAHAEINALRKLTRQRNQFNHEDAILFTNAESCPMCMSCAIRASIGTFYFGAAAGTTTNPQASVQEMASKAKQSVELHSHILEQECTEQIDGGYLKLASRV